MSIFYSLSGVVCWSAQLGKKVESIADVRLT